MLVYVKMSRWMGTNQKKKWNCDDQTYHYYWDKGSKTEVRSLRCFLQIQIPENPGRLQKLPWTRQLPIWRWTENWDKNQHLSRSCKQSKHLRNKCFTLGWASIQIGQLFGTTSWGSSSTQVWNKSHHNIKYVSIVLFGHFWVT